MASLIKAREHEEVACIPKDWQGPIKFRPHVKGRHEGGYCLAKTPEGYTTSYYVGCDWIVAAEQAIQVRPKLDDTAYETDVLGMLMQAMQQAEALAEMKDLLQVRFDAPYIELEQADDLLTPFLVMQFVQVVKRLVKKGLRRSYYPVRRNLNGRVKGKVLIADTIRHNHLRQKPLHTYCRYDEFGYDSLENRLIKKGLRFAQRYLSGFALQDRKKGTSQNPFGHMQQAFSYVLPAFSQVSDEVELHEVKHSPVNPFYPEYAEAIRLARLILRRFGYQLTKVETKQKIATPPYWIDMSKLFELYVLGLLREANIGAVHYQFYADRRYPDFLWEIPADKGWVVDAKYKPGYASEPKEHEGDFSYDYKDIDQLSAYARNTRVRRRLKADSGEVIPCLIVYPLRHLSASPHFATGLSLDHKKPIDTFERFYKIGVSLPVIDKN